MTTLEIRAEQRIMDSQEVQRFFPTNIAELFGLPSSGLRFFGIASEKERVLDSVPMVNKGYGLYALVDRCVHQGYDDLSFLNSKSRWIKGEHYPFDDLRKKHREQIDGTYPLLYLYISTWLQPSEHPSRFAELLRYADHERFRKRGIASAVVESVCERMKEEGTQYLFVNYGWTSWPKESHVVPVSFIDTHMQEEIMDCFPEGYCDPEEGDSEFKSTFKRAE